MNVNDKAVRWISLHAFVGNYVDHDALLTDVLSPLVASIRTEESDASFFFLRYWNGGPHLRLRFGGPGLDECRIKERVCIALSGNSQIDNLESMMTDYSAVVTLMSHLDQRISYTNLSTAEPIEPFQQRGSVQVRPYTVDTKRFGGMRTAVYAERHFCVSSAIALSLLGSTVGNMPRRFMIALQLAVATLATLSLSRDDQMSLLLRRGGLQQIFFPDFHGSAFRDLGFSTYEHQLDDLIPIIEQIGSFDSLAWQIPVVALWRRELERCNRLMSPLIEETGPEFCDVAMDFLHLLFNRMGILTAEELCLYELLSRSFEHVGCGDKVSIKPPP